MSPIFGIDFGTSNSALSVCMDGEVRMLDVDPGNPISNSLKSILYFLKEDGKTQSYVGYEGVTQYIDTEAEGRYMQSVKTFLPDSGFEKTAVYGQNYTLEELISIFLKVMKEKGEALIGSRSMTWFWDVQLYSPRTKSGKPWPANGSDVPPNLPGSKILPFKWNRLQLRFPMRTA